MVTSVNREKLYTLIKRTLTEYDEMTARELAVTLCFRGLIETPTRQEVAPRLTELEKKGVVEVCGTKVDEHTRKVVSIYRMVQNEVNHTG